MKKAKLIKKSEVAEYLEKLETKPVTPVPKKENTFTTARILVAEKLAKRGSS